MNVEQEQKKLLIFSKKVWVEIKSLEQEYKRNQTQINDLEERKGDISSRVQILLDKLNTKAEKIDSFCYENKLGEFAE